MTTERNQSQIGEVRDQLSLDYADGAYLNVVGNNLGMDRPVFGFGDDLWRALVKAIALQYKQILTRFHVALSLLFGPQETQVGTLAVDAAVGDRVIYVTDASRFPQIGTVVLDKGQPTEESLEYCFINYTDNTIWLAPDASCAFAHTQGDADDDAESLLIVVDSAGTKLIVTDASEFPTSGFPYSGVVGRGTDAEETVSITAVDQEEGSVTIAAALTNTHEVLVPSVIQSVLDRPYTAFASFLTLFNSTMFGGEGTLLLRERTDAFTATGGTATTVVAASGTFSANVHAGYWVRFADNTTTVALQGVERAITGNTTDTLTCAALPAVPVAGDTFVIIEAPFNATAGTVTTVTVNPGTFTADRQVGYKIVFDGNVTAAIAGLERYIVANTDSVLTFDTALGSPPAAGDTFRIRPIVEFSSNDPGTSTIAGEVTLIEPIFDVTLPEGALVELMVPGSKVSLAPVRVEGFGWDVYQVTPRLIEIYLPTVLQDVSDLRSASYLHTTYDASLPSTTLSGAVTAGDSFVDVVDSSTFPIVGVIAIDPGGTNERVGYYKDGTVANRLQIATQTVANSFLAGVTVDLYQPRYGTTSILIGSPFDTPDTFPGPYVYDETRRAPTGTVAETTLAEQLPGPTWLELGQIITNGALEVADASFFDLVNFPYNVVVGDGSSNREVVQVFDVNLKGRCATTLTTNTTGGTGVVELPVTALSGGGAGDAADFPDAQGYRVLLDKGGANEEVVYVVGTLTGPDRLVLQLETQNNHAIGETVELMADVLSTSALIDSHTGKVDYSQRSAAVSSTARWPVFGSPEVEAREKIQPQISAFDLTSAAGLDTTGGTVILNFGHQQLNVELPITVARSAGDTVLTFADSSAYPTSYPFKVIMSPGTAVEESVLVTANSGTQLTIGGGTFGLKNAHPIGADVRWVPGNQEELEYDSISGNALSFSPAIVLEYEHSIDEPVIDSSVTSDPKTNGYDFPFRMPPDIRERLEFLFDLLRAAGVEVDVIDAR